MSFCKIDFCKLVATGSTYLIEQATEERAQQAVTVEVFCAGHEKEFEASFERRRWFDSLVREEEPERVQQILFASLSDFRNRVEREERHERIGSAERDARDKCTERKKLEAAKDRAAHGITCTDVDCSICDEQQ